MFLVAHCIVHRTKREDYYITICLGFFSVENLREAMSARIFTGFAACRSSAIRIAGASLPSCASLSHRSPAVRWVASSTLLARTEPKRLLLRTSNGAVQHTVESATFATSGVHLAGSALRADDRFASATANASCDWLEVSWTDNQSGRYPYVWLRDNCRCPACYYPSCHQRSMLMANLDLDVKPTRVEIEGDGRTLGIDWTDGHASTFPADWLRLHQFDKTDFDPVGHVTPESWGAEFRARIPTYLYDDVITRSGTLYDWLESLVVHGLAIVRGAPREPGVLRVICERVAYPRETCYGRGFRVENLFESSSLAYTSAELGLHVDLPFYAYRPGVQMLHCIRQCEGEGGENQFVDGRRVAEQLKEHDPELYKIMTEVKVDYRALGHDAVPFHIQQARTLIELDESGDFKSVAYNDQVRSPYMSIPTEQVTAVYRAIKRFHQAIYKEANFIRVKLAEGDVVTFDNNRVMHGRTGYSVSVGEGEATKSRLLEGGYLDWDEIHSRMRLLDEELHGTPRL